MSEHHPITSRRKAQAISTSLFLVGLATLIFTDDWWPGIMLIVGLPVALRQFLLGRTYDMIVSLLVFVGTFITVQFDISWRLFLPILFTLGAIYILFREFFGPDETTEEEKEEELNHEIEEKKK
jgi:ABC-type multidrug transport system fused ATPase/permease subunit